MDDRSIDTQTPPGKVASSVVGDILSRVRAALSDRYEVESELGRGGMAVVFLAHDLRLNRHVAIKVIRPELAQVVPIERFLREVHIEATLDHPNIVALFDSGEAEGLPYYVMPYVKGMSLRERLKLQGQLSLEETINITRQVAEGLEHAHRQGVVHRDIKPENILISEYENRVLIADFGIAKATAEAGGESLTTYGIVLGTPEYMSPEQAMGDPVDSRTDIYALGCVAYEMLAGDPPFTGRSRSAIVAKHLHEHVSSLNVVRRNAPSGVANAIEKALEKVPADRFGTAVDLAEAVEQGKDTPPTPPPPTTWQQAKQYLTANKVMTGLLLLVMIAVALPLARLLSRAAPGFTGRPESVVVLPYTTATSTSEEDALAVDLANRVTLELNSWETIRAVPQVSLAGPKFDLGLSGPTLEFIDDGIALAENSGVQALVAVRVSVRGDSVLADADLFDAATGRYVGRPMHVMARVGNSDALVALLAMEILGLGGFAPNAADLRRRSDNPDALLQDDEGLRYLARWRLREAERSFRRAIALDSTFAVARNHLAQTLYWQAAEQPSRITTLGPEISQVSNAAVRHSAGLLSRDSLHIHAFYAFQLGEYETARARYRALLSRDTTDVYAWLMLGSVEYRDLWLVELEDGSYLPRSNFNVALNAFSETIRLNPSFDLGYGHLFDIEGKIARSARIGACLGYELPRDERITFWERMVPDQAVSFCAWASDSITWVRKPVFDSLDRSSQLRGAGRLIERTLTMVRRWTEYAPNEPKPQEEMSLALLRQRRLPGRAAPEISDSIAALALAYSARALQLASDTLPIQLVRLANLYLGVGDLDGALTLLNTAVDRVSPEDLPSIAINAYLATGQPLRAMDIAATPVRRMYIVDSLAGSLIPYGGAEPAYDRARMLGAVGVGGSVLQRELDEMSRIWNQPHYSDRQRQLLHRDVAQRLVTALAFDPQTLVAWADGSEIRAPLWNALRFSESDTARARTFLQESLAGEHPGFSDVTTSTLHGLVAARVGDHRLAVELYSPIDSVPLHLSGYSTMWGSHALSLMLRADSYAALGDTALALRYYERFTGDWANADSLAVVHVERVRGEMERLRGGQSGGRAR